MQRITNLLLGFGIGFFGAAIFMDKPEILFTKSIIFLGIVTIAFILNAIDYFKNIKNGRV